MSLWQVRSHDIHAHLEVRLIEVIRHIPADLAVLAPLLYDGVEERQHKDERLEGWVRTFSEWRRIDLEVGTTHVELQSIGRLCYNLHTQSPTCTTTTDVVTIMIQRQQHLVVGPRGSVVERQSLTSVLSPSCARPVADGWPLMWVSRPL